MKSLLLTLSVFGLFLANGMAQSADETAVRAAHDAFNAAAKAGDGAALDKLLAEGLQYSHSNGKVETKAECIAALVKSKVNFEIVSQTIHVYGKTATTRAKLTAHTPTGAIPLTMLQVWVKNAKKWQMVERHTTRVPAS